MRFWQVVQADDGGIGNLVTNSKKKKKKKNYGNTPSMETMNISHVGLMLATSELIQQMRFHLPLFTLTLIRTSQKPPQVSVKK